MNKIILIIALSLIFSNFLRVSNQDDTLEIEKHIKNSIINSDYDKSIRPSVTVEILMNIALKQIMALDERGMIMTTSSYLFVSWNDPRLKWNSNETDNVNTISVGAKSIWLPDLYVTNTAEQNGFLSITDTNLAFIQSDGLVYLTLSLVGNSNFNSFKKNYKYV
jgi:hypothetical protein